METIHLSPYNWIKPLSNNLVRISNSKTGATTYNLKYFNIIAFNNTQEAVINRCMGVNKKTPEDELKQLTTMSFLKKKIISYNNFQDKLKDAKQYGNEDKIILIKRGLTRAKNLIIKYYNQLKQDMNFCIDYVGDTTYKMVYSGKYVTATKQGEVSESLGVF